MIEDETSSPDEVQRKPEARARVRVLDQAIGALAAGFVGGVLGVVTLYTHLERAAGRVKEAWHGWRDSG